MMELKCQHVSASEAGDEIFQVLFEENEDQEDTPYVLIQRAWLEEFGREFRPIYVETHNERLIGDYATVDVTLTRTYLTLILPSPANETIEVEFTTSDSNFREVKRMLDIILQNDVAEQDQEDTNQKVAPFKAFPLL